MIKITRITEHKDGSATIDFECDKKLKRLIRRYYNKKRVTKKLVAKFIKEALTNYANQHSKGKIKDLNLGVK